jgi:hypothetical protein
VKLCIMFAFGDANSGEPALKDRGYPAAAVISVIPTKQRVDKRADAEILIDESRWKGMTDGQRRALLDRMVTYLEMQKDDVGLVKTDDIGRPKLKLLLCDWHLSGFRSIAERYGEDAMEVQEARRFREVYGDSVLAADKLFA